MARREEGPPGARMTRKVGQDPVRIASLTKSVDRVGDQDRYADGNENDQQQIEEHVRLQFWKLNALICAQSKSIAAEPRFHRRAEVSPQHTSTGVDLSAERQEKQSADMPAANSGNKMSGTALPPTSP